MPPIITKLPRVKGYRIFREFDWPDSLPEFKRFNLVYGWNGSGKSTLASLFKVLQNKTALLASDVRFECDGHVHKACDFGLETITPNVRVFDADFVRKNVFAKSHVGAIYYLGEESAEKQRQVEELKAKTDQLSAEHVSTVDRIRLTDKALDDLCTNQGKLIKEALRSEETSNHYNNYNKSSFVATVTRVAALDEEAFSEIQLDEAQRNVLRAKKSSRPKDKLDIIETTLPELSVLGTRVRELLGRTVISATIEALAEDSEAAAWVKQGLSLHVKQEGIADRCRFCDQPLLEARLRALEGHFNDQYERLQYDIESALKELQASDDRLNAIILPDKSALVDHLVSDFVRASEKFNAERSKAYSYMAGLREALEQKLSAPFQGLQLEELLGEFDMPDMAVAATSLASIASLIETHSSDCENFDEVVRAARKALEEALVCDAVGDYREKHTSIASLRAEQGRIAAELASTARQITDLEREISEHQKPAEELNAELADYLGRDELQFKVEGTAYAITRAGQPAEHLSEGERTGIAFLYFLKSLKDKGFSLPDGVVVIDDPISSLDANSIFSAFGFMRDRTRDAGQLFILTHNFTFFRQVKNWFQRKKHSFYMVEAHVDEQGRYARLNQLDSLLRDYESDYHYLFKRVFELAAPKAGGALAEHYGMPNMARRLLETFLSFRYPAAAKVPDGGFSKLLGGVTSVDGATKGRILRFLHTCSHFDRVGDPEHDPTVLAETPPIMLDVLKLIEAEDKRHYDQMVELIGAESK